MAGKNYGDKIITSIYGRRFGLQIMTTAQNGGRLDAELAVGPDAWREQVGTGLGASTAGESTGTNLRPWGVSFLNGTSAASSSVYVIDPPIPGVRKTVVFSSANTPQYLKTKNGETFRTSADSTIATVIMSTLTGATVELIGLTTGLWGLLTNGTTVISRAATT